MIKKKIPELEKVIDYPFKNRFILEKALTHKSYAVEQKLKYDNQRLEFLGDAVIEIILSEYLFVRYQSDNEGHLTKMRSSLAQQESLASLAKFINLGEFIYLGKGEVEAGGVERSSTLSDLFEALLGAIYLDGGLEMARKFLVPLIEKLYSDPDSLISGLNPKGMLQEFTQKHQQVTPIYKLEETEGPDHAPSYLVAVFVKDKLLATGKAGRRKLAESEAARKALEILQVNLESEQGDSSSQGSEDASPEKVPETS